VRRKRKPSVPPEDLPRGLEERLRRMENALNLRSPDPLSESEDEIAPPRFQLGGSEHPVYHGETSMHEDIASPSKLVDPSPSIMDVSGWSDQNIRELTKLRHKYATAEEGEAWMNAYFTWASVTYAVVNRSIFLRKLPPSGRAYRRGHGIGRPIFLPSFAPRVLPLWTAFLAQHEPAG